MKTDEIDEKTLTKYSIDSIINFGRYKGQSISSLINAVEGRQYLKWAIKNNIIELDDRADYILKVNDSDIMICNYSQYLKVYSKNDIIDFGKYKGETIDSLFGRDDSRAYLRWLKENNIICLDLECNERLTANLHNINYMPKSSYPKEYLGWDDEGLACGVLECDSY